MTRAGLPADRQYGRRVGLAEALRHRHVRYRHDAYRPLVDAIRSREAMLRDLPTEALSEAALRLGARIRASGFPGGAAASAGDPALGRLLAEGFALVREFGVRALGLRAYDEQVLTGLVLWDGGIAEMQTGEGKTLAAVFPAALRAMEMQGMHILTFNDYLARRDTAWMGPLYRGLGLSADCVQEGDPPARRREAYGADVTYLTAREAGFDHLRSFLLMRPEDEVLRPFYAVLADEADSILIDEARNPLILVAEDRTGRADPAALDRVARDLQPGLHYDVDTYSRNAFLTEDGIREAERRLGCGDLYAVLPGRDPGEPGVADPRRTAILTGLQDALQARVLLVRDVDYLVRDGRVELVDEFTGRVADRRRWPHGLHEAVEAKEGLPPSRESRILASTTLQDLIRLYPNRCGMTGTAVSGADELHQVYGFEVYVIPPHRPNRREDRPDRLYARSAARWQAVESAIAASHAEGRPVLVGTGSVAESEALSDRLRVLGIPCQVLNAKNDEIEAALVARAGLPGTVTVSTNMAGRGTDIRLGGPDEVLRDRVTALGGLHVIGTQRHESLRIDLQLRGRAGRQGDPGMTGFFLSLEDPIFVKYRFLDLVPEGLRPEDGDTPLEDPVLLREAARVQRIVEGQNHAIRSSLDRFRVVIREQDRVIRRFRDEILRDVRAPGLFQRRLPDRFAAMLDRMGADPGRRRARELERAAWLLLVPRAWSDYLESMEYLRSSIHILRVGGKDPLSEFNRTAVEAFDRMRRDLEDQVAALLLTVAPDGSGFDPEEDGLALPSATWTWMVPEEDDLYGFSSPVATSIAATVNPTLWTLAALARRFRERWGP